jgi:hypothetical protein
MISRTLRRSALRWPYRLVASALAVLFLTTGAVDAYGLHRCPHHDGLPADAEEPTAAHAHAAHAADPSHDDEHGSHGPCTCVGTCSVTAVALPSAADAAWTAARVDAARPVAALHRNPFSLDRDYFHPFANAPPPVR